MKKKEKKYNSDIIQNLTDIKLTSAEISVLEKGLNFCPTVKTPNTIKLLDDLYFFCRKLKLREFFFDPSGTKSKLTDNSDTERCEMITKITNPYYNPPKNPSTALNNYISAVKKDVVELLHKPNRQPSNMTLHVFLLKLVNSGLFRGFIMSCILINTLTTAFYASYSKEHEPTESENTGP